MKNNLNLLDKARSYFDPEYGFKASKLRLATAIMVGNSNYDINIPTENYEIGDTTTADDDLEGLETARDTSRLKEKNNGFASGVMQCATDHVIGTGLRPKSTINRRRLTQISEEKIKYYEDLMDDYFQDWVDSQFSDVTGINDFYLQQRLAYFTYKRDGECFATLPIIDKQINLKLIGAENVEGEIDGFRFGIKTDSNNRPISYRVLQKDNSFKEVKNDTIKQNMLHVFKRKRIDSLRGMPFISGVARDLDYIDDYMKEELKAARVAAIFMGSIETAATNNIFDKPAYEVDLSGTTPRSKNDPTKKTFRESQITQLSMGEKLNIHTQGRDNPNFDKIVTTALQKVAACTRIPMEIILTIFTSSYSASRASMLIMDKFVQPERKIMNRQFNNPIRNQVIEYGVLKGDLDIPGFFDFKSDYLKCQWEGDAIGSVDPVKDVKAKIAAIDGLLMTRTKATSDLGNGDFEKNMKIREKEDEIIRTSKLIDNDIDKTNEEGVTK